MLARSQPFWLMQTLRQHQLVGVCNIQKMRKYAMYSDPYQVSRVGHGICLRQSYKRSWVWASEESGRHTPAAFAAALTAAKPGMRGPLTGSMMTSESRDRPTRAALPVRMPATCRLDTKGHRLCSCSRQFSMFQANLP